VRGWVDSRAGLGHLEKRYVFNLSELELRFMISILHGVVESVEVRTRKLEAVITVHVELGATG
jgi:hypothetical protein